MSNTEAAKAVEIGNGEDSATNQEDAEQWVVYMDGASNENGSGAGVMLISLEGHKIHCALRFGFAVSNNEARYMALIAGLCLERELRAYNLKIYNDS